MIRACRLQYRTQLIRVILRFGHNLRRQDLIRLSDTRLEQVARKVLLTAKCAQEIAVLVRLPARHGARQ
jgi:hypothetical protein